MTAREDIDAPGPSRRSVAAPWWGTASVAVLLADEDPAAGAGLRELLATGARATFCGDGAEALWQAGRTAPAVVVLSATLPGVSAAEVAEVLARQEAAPDTIAVGVGPGQADRAGPVLAAGAGRVVTRPYRSAEIGLLLRECQERREQGAHGAAVLTVGPLQMDVPAFEARVAGRPIRLTLREFELLRLLMVHAGTVVSHRHIRRQLGAVRGSPVSPDAVALHVRRLRAHLAGIADIVVVRGLGYRLRVPTAEGERELG